MHHGLDRVSQMSLSRWDVCPDLSQMPSHPGRLRRHPPLTAERISSSACPQIATRTLDYNTEPLS